MSEEMARLQHDIMSRQQQLRELQCRTEPVDEMFVFGTPDGDRTLLQLFGDQDALITIHNMGKRCAYCTAYADGLNGLLPYLESRSSVVLVSPDDPETQAEFAAERGWRFALASMSGTESRFAKAMGFYLEGSEWPGFSVFSRAGETISRVGSSFFDPGDAYCPLWPILDFLPGGSEQFVPAFER